MWVFWSEAAKKRAKSRSKPSANWHAKSKDYKQKRLLRDHCYVIQSILWIYFVMMSHQIWARQNILRTTMKLKLFTIFTRVEAKRKTTIENRISALNNNLKQKRIWLQELLGCYRRKGQKDPEVYEKNMKALSEEVKAYQREKQLILDLEEAKTKGLEVKRWICTSKASRAEKQLKNLRIKQTRQQKLLEMKIKWCKSLAIKKWSRVMKRHRIKLVSQKQKANERFRQFKKEQEHRLAALRKQNRTKQIQLQNCKYS